MSALLAIIAILEAFIAVPWGLNSTTTTTMLLPSLSLPGFTHYPRFFVLGDWGRQGEYNQTVVAEAMARKARSFHPDFIVSTGDNFYEEGLVSADDELFETSFTDIYTQPELVNVPWHVVVGNHDYGETKQPKTIPAGCKTRDDYDNGACFYGPAHQLDVRLTERDARWHCERFFSLSLANGDVEMFFIDTTPIIRSYAEEVWATNRGGVLQQSPEDQLRELEARLSASQASWKFVVGHHPIRTNHRPDHEFMDMVADLEPLITKYNVQAYFAGHDHNVQHLHDPATGYHHITSGAGSDIGHRFYGTDNSPFQFAGNAFVAVEVGRRVMKVQYIGVDSDTPLFTITIPKTVSL